MPHQHSHQALCQLVELAEMHIALGDSKASRAATRTAMDGLDPDLPLDDYQALMVERIGELLQLHEDALMRRRRATLSGHDDMVAAGLLATIEEPTDASD